MLADMCSRHRRLIGARHFARKATAVVVLLLATVAAARATDPQSDSARRVLWRLPSGETKAYLFRGTVGGGLVQGTLDDGQVVVTVDGVVAPDGAFSGTLRRADGTVAGTFVRDAPEQDSAETPPVLIPGQASAPAPVDAALGGGTWWVTDDMDPLTP